MTKRYTVVYERGRDRLWVASVRGLSGCHTQGRTIEQARQRIREALALYVSDEAAEKAVLVDRVKLPPGLAKRVALATKARERLSRVSASTQSAMTAAVSRKASGP